MALTDLEIKQWVENYVTTNPGYDWGEWNGYTFGRGLHHKYSVQLYSLQDMYGAKFKRLYLHYKELREGFRQGVSDSFIQATSEDVINDLKAIKDKGWRLADKLRTLNAEIAGREAGVFGPGELFDREYRGTEYYIDFTDGSNDSPHTGLKYGSYAADAGSGATTLIETSELGRTVDDDWNGAWIWNVTRSAGAKITASTYAAGTWTLTHASISGQVSGDTYYILDAWLTMAQYAEATERSAGDIVYVRANTTESATVAFASDDDGTKDSRISVIGCDSITNDPWGDGSDVKPILSFGDNAIQWTLQLDDYWYLERLIVKEAGGTVGNVHVSSGYGFYAKDCEFTDNFNPGNEGIEFSSAYDFILDGCILKDNLENNIKSTQSTGLIKNCVLDSGGGGTKHGIRALYSHIEVIDTDFGQTIPHSDADIYAINSSVVLGRNNRKATADVVFGVSFIYEEDEDGVKGAQVGNVRAGKVTKDTGITRVGGADSSAKMLPINKCGLYAPLKLIQSEINQPFKIWTSASLTTITVYLRSLGTWGTYPTADELYLEASYLSAGSGGARTKVQSNDVLSHASDWKAFDVTFTPLQEGFVYLNVFLKKYEDAGDGAYIDVKPIVT